MHNKTVLRSNIRHVESGADLEGEGSAAPVSAEHLLDPVGLQWYCIDVNIDEIPQGCGFSPVACAMEQERKRCLLHLEKHDNIIIRASDCLYSGGQL